MKKNKLLIVTILLGFLMFGMSYNTLIKENVVGQLVKQIAKVEKKIVGKETNNKIESSPVKKEAIANSIVAATVSVTNAVVINGGGNAQPGSQLDFTITINNTGTDATGTTFQDILDTNLTLVPNSLKVTPIAVNDAYNCIGNVGITLNTAQGVLANDVSPDGTAMTVAILANGAHGTAALSTDGSFTYNPTAGYSGADSFTYTLTNASGKTDTATVNITISTPIYFVNSSVTTNGNGTLSSPFKLVQNAVGTGSNPIFIYAGTGSSGTTLTLSTNQKVIGQGATASLVSILGLTVPSYSNALPTTGGTSPTFSAITLSSNNDIQGVILSSNMTGSSVGTLKVRDVTITGGSTTAVSINGGGVLDCIFKSISSNGGVGGIIMTNTTGSFQVTGTGTTAGSGGTIQNISDKGANFNSCTNITLKNMNFVGSINAAISLVASTGITLDNISVSGTNNNFGILINNVTNFSLNNSTLTGCGSNVASSNVGGIYAENLKGTSTITNTNVNDSWGRGFYAYNNQGTSNLTITACQFKNSFNKANGGSNFVFEGYGTSNNTLTLKANDFSNPKEYGLTLNFGGNSTNNIQVGGNTIATGNTINAAASSPGSNGLSLQSNGLAVVNYNIINNTIKSSFNGSFTCNVGSQDNSIMNGRINSNTIDGGGIGSVSNGISVAAYGNAKHIAEILNNNITNANNYGILSEANDNTISTANARMDATIKNNNISLVANSYAHVGVISVGTSTSSLISAANIGNNTTNSPVTNLVATFDVLAQGVGNKVILQGTTPLVNGTGDRSAALAAFWNANNSANPGTALDEQGGGTIQAGTVLVPSNPSASKIAAPKNLEEQTTPIAEIQNITLAKTNQSAKNSSANATAETILVGPFTLPAGKGTVITFSAKINAANLLPANTCAVTNMASVSGTNFATVNSNITTTSIKPGNATFTNTTENIPCLGSTSVTLNATCPLGTTATWYTTLAGGTSFATGTSVTAIPTANNTTYCVACEVTYCASDRLLVKTVTGTPSTTLPAETVTACDTYTWPENNTTYTTSGVYTNIVGCNTKTLNLTITNSSASSQNVTACDTYTWPENNTTYTTSGVYTNVVGCNTKTLNLTITNSSASSQNVTACDTYTWPENNTTYTTSGVYTNVVGCNTKTLNLTITNSSAINTSVSLNSGILTSNQFGATYQWYKCPNTLLANETNQSYTPSTVGDYKVEIKEGGCTVTSNCITINSLAVGEFKLNEFKIYPNPSKGIIKIVTAYGGNYLIIDQSGKTIKSINLEENAVNTLNLENLTEGIYFIISNGETKMKAQKFLIKK